MRAPVRSPASQSAAKAGPRPVGQRVAASPDVTLDALQALADTSAQTWQLRRIAEGQSNNAVLQAAFMPFVTVHNAHLRNTNA